MESAHLDKIKALKKGKREGVSWLIDSYADKLMGFFYRNGLQINDAEDMVQEVFLRVIKAIGRYKEKDRFEMWLFRIAHNLLIDYWRTKRQVLEADINYDGSIFETADRAERADPIGEVIAKEESDLLQRALEKLNNSQREIILLRYFGGMSFEQIAKITNQPLGTVLSQAHRGLKKLKDIINDFKAREDSA